MASNDPTMMESMETEECPITEECIAKNQDFIIDNLRRITEIRTLLETDGILSSEESNGIKLAGISGKFRANETLIKHVLEKNAVSSFIRALRDSDQRPLIDYLLTNGEAESEITDECVERHKDSLTEQLEPDYGMLDELLKNEILNYRECKRIKQSLDRSEEVIDYVIKKKAISGLIKCLRQSDQRHVVNFLIGNGEKMNVFGDLWPLTKDQLKLLDVNQGWLVDNIDSCELLDRLLSRSVINQRQRKAMTSESSETKKNDLLLDILRRRSNEDFLETIDCLEQCNQAHVATVLKGGGVVYDGRFSLEGETETVNAIEDEIATNHARELADKPIEEVRRILGATYLKVISIRRGNSIHLYIYCQTLKELIAVHELVITGSIKNIAEDLFSRLVPHRNRVVVSDYYFKPEQYEKLKTFLEEKELRERTETFEPMEGEDIEMEEISEEQKSFLPKVDREQSEEYTEARSTEMEKGAASAAAAECLTDEEISAAIIRNNMDFFNEQLNPATIVNKLHSLGILSDDQTRYIKTLKRSAEKNDEIMGIVRSRSIEDYYRFVDCLRETGQTMVANVAEKGGLATRVKVNHRKVDNITHMEEEIATTLNHALLPTSPKTDELHRLLGELRKGNIEIASAHQDRGIVLWFWCRSENAAVKLDDLYEETQLMPLLKALYRAIHRSIHQSLISEKDIPEIINVYMDYSDREFVSRRISVFQSRENVKLAEPRSICGIAILRNRLCVLCRDPTTLLVYKEQNLTAPPEEIPVEVVGSPVDMACCIVSKCLYITDSNDGAIYRVIISQRAKKFELWPVSSSDPYTLSVTRDGHIVMVKRGSPPTLEEFDSDAQLLNKIELRSPIAFPNHAVGTSSGNFVISYGSDSAPGGIAVITKEGQIVNRFDFKYEPIPDLTKEINLSDLMEEALSSNFLSYLAIDEKDQVYGTDERNGGVVFFDSELKLEKIIGKGSLTIPYKMQFLLRDKLLLVVHGVAKNIVSIFDAN